MKKIIALVLSGIMMVSCVGVFAEDSSTKLPDVLKTPNERYADSIAIAIENSGFNKEEIDKDNIYITEVKRIDSIGEIKDTDLHYVALPSKETEHIRFATISKGKHSGESMNTLSWVEKMETHLNTQIESYINNNSLEDVSEAVNVKLHIITNNSVRTYINTYKVISGNEIYYIPYYISKNYNVAGDNNCDLECGKAYTEMNFTQILKTEGESYITFKEAEKKAEEERIADEAQAEEEKYRPTVSLDKNGDEVIKVNGINLDDVLTDLTDSIEQMGFASTIKMGVNDANENYIVTYRWQKGCKVNDISKFAQGLFDELKTQVATGKPSLTDNISNCDFSLKHNEGNTSVRHNVEISVWNDGVKIIVNRDNAIEFKVKNSDAITDYIKKYGNANFNGFTFEKNDENTPHIRGNIDGFTKTDVIEFEFVLPNNTHNDISKEVSSLEKTIKGTFEKYKENKYKSTYILTLSGNLGSVSFCERTQSSLSGEEEIFSNNIPVSFLNTIRYEDGNVVEYKVGKESRFYKFKMIFKSNDISEAYFDDIKCTNLKYTQLTEDKKLAEEFAQKDKEVVLREAQECADTLHGFGLFKGTDKGYELEKGLTREESATILVRLLGEEDKVDADDFDEVFVDVDKDRWSYACVMYCYKNNITKGTGADTFSPDVQIDANQFIALMMRLLGYIEVNPDTALEKSVEYDLLPEEKIDELTMKKVFTRSDMVQIVYNSLKTQMDNEVLFADYLLEKGILTEKEIEQIK